MKLTTDSYEKLSIAIKRTDLNFWYASPELWCCQDYDLFFDGVRLMNKNDILLIPPLVKGRLDEELQAHYKQVGSCDILFAPHNIEESINPMLWSGFKREIIDQNYINSTEKVFDLRGNKLKKLRNNVRNFGRLLESRPLRLSDIPRAVELCEKYHFISSEFDDIGYNTKILSNLDGFNLIHRGYWEDGEMVAFNVGAPLSHDTASFLISKSRHDIKYLVDYVRHDFHVDCFARGFAFVNDGSDLDSEGLAQLKRKFAPVNILPVYSLEWEG